MGPQRGGGGRRVRESDAVATPRIAESSTSPPRGWGRVGKGSGPPPSRRRHSTHPLWAHTPTLPALAGPVRWRTTAAAGHLAHHPRVSNAGGTPAPAGRAPPCCTRSAPQAGGVPPSASPCSPAFSTHRVAGGGGGARVYRLCYGEGPRVAQLRHARGPFGRRPSWASSASSVAHLDFDEALLWAWGVRGAG